MKAFVALIALAVSTSAFASDTSGRTYGRQDALVTRDIQEGTVLMIRPVDIENRSKVNKGTIIGGAVGYGATRSINSKYRSATRIAGTTIGAVAGGAINNSVTKRHGVEIVVKTYDNRGRSKIVSVVQDDDQPIQQGQHVLLSGRGRDTHVIPIPAQ